MKRALVVVDMTVEQVANISFQKEEMIRTIRHLAESGNFVPRRRIGLVSDGSQDAKIDSRLWFEKGA